MEEFYSYIFMEVWIDVGFFLRVVCFVFFVEIYGGFLEEVIFELGFYEEG